MHVRCYCLTAFFASLLASDALPQSAVWTNPATGVTAGSWSVASNWNPATVPGPLNTAQINNGGETRITSTVSTSRIEVGKNGGTGILTSTAAVAISTDSDLDIGEIGGTFASGPIVVNSNGAATISDATSLSIGTGGAGDLDIGQTSATSGAQAFGVGTLTIERVANVQVTENVEVGKTGGSATADGKGTLVVDAVGTMQIGMDLDIGQSGGTGQATGFGMAIFTNTSSITVGLGIDVGRTTGSSVATNSGDGNLAVSDAILTVGFADVLNPGSINIGGTSTTANQVANAVGVVTLDRVTLDVASRIKVGELSGLGTNPATSSVGTLNITDSDVAVNRLEVATVIGGTAGTVQGTVRLESSFVALDSALTLSPNSRLEFGLAGTTKADGSGTVEQFSAIDADFVTLDGDLSVFLVDGFVPASGDTFQIISGLRTGTFGPVDFPDLPGLAWEIQYDANSAVLAVLSTGLTGDYNGNNIVDAADYTVWLDSLGQTGSGIAADGNNDSIVNQTDYDLWKAHFGMTLPVATNATDAVPEPTTRLLCLFAFAISACLRNRLKRNHRCVSQWEGY